MPSASWQGELRKAVASAAGWHLHTGNFEQAETGPDLFRKACEFGLEGLVSKRADRPYRAGRSKDWVKFEESRAPRHGAGERSIRANDDE